MMNGTVPFDLHYVHMCIMENYVAWAKPNNSIINNACRHYQYVHAHINLIKHCMTKRPRLGVGGDEKTLTFLPASPCSKGMPHGQRRRHSCPPVRVQPIVRSTRVTATAAAKEIARPQESPIQQVTRSDVTYATHA